MSELRSVTEVVSWVSYLEYLMVSVGEATTKTIQVNIGDNMKGSKGTKTLHPPRIHAPVPPAPSSPDVKYHGNVKTGPHNRGK